MVARPAAGWHRVGRGEGRLRSPERLHRYPAAM